MVQKSSPFIMEGVKTGALILIEKVAKQTVNMGIVGGKRWFGVW